MNLHGWGPYAGSARSAAGPLFIRLSVYPDERLKEHSGCFTVILADNLSKDLSDVR